MKKQILQKFIPLILLFITTQSLGQETNIKNKLGIGFNYPGLSVRYGISSKLMLESKIQYGDSAFVFGPRMYYYFPKVSERILAFAGIEADYISFDGDVSAGSGTAIEIFGGGEYSINDKLSFALDLGPSLISISDKDTGESVSGIEYVVNLSVIYFIH